VVDVVKIGSSEDLTEKQRDILAEALENPEKTNSEIASATGASESYVAEVRRDLEDDAEIDETSNGAGGVVLLLLIIFAIWWLLDNGVV